MKEKLYAIPVNDGFNADCECPVCFLYKTLEDAAVQYTMGPSYMEDDTRAETDEHGFCEKHIKQLYDMDNRLGMALVLKTHFDKVIHDIKAMEKEPVKGKGFFKKDIKVSNPVNDYIDRLQGDCFVCRRINNVFERYIDTIFYLWEDDKGFREKFASCKGFCTNHYGLLYAKAGQKLSGSQAAEFTELLNKLYIENMERVRDDLEWFINKFDYKYANESWKNSKDSIPRAMIKTNGVLENTP